MLLTSLLPHCHHHTIIIGPYGVSLRKSISRGWPSFVRHIQFEVGAGFTVRFWQDIRCGDSSLCMLYPRLFSLSRNKEAYMADLMKFPNGVLFWDLNFRRYSEGWELESLYNLMSRIYGASLKGVGDDQMCWKPVMGRGFAVRSYYQVLTKSFDQSFPWKTVWKSKVPSRVAFFVWIVALGNVLTIDNLRRRWILILDWCCMCKRNGESVDHLLIHSPIAFDLKSMVFTLFGIHWVMPKTVEELLACWQGKFGSHRNSAIRIVVLHCLMWCIWQERNNQHFEDLERSVSDLKLFFLKTLLDWVTVLGFRSFSSVHGFMDFCTLCT